MPDAAAESLVVTHRKIATLAPDWASFRGASILFRPIGAEADGPGWPGVGALYRTLAGLIARDDAAALRRCGYCALPPSSYHMTLSDLVHDGNVGHVAAPARAHFGKTPGIAPGAQYPDVVRQVVHQAGAPGPGTTAFAFDALRIRSGSALTADFRPCDPQGRDYLDLLAWRRRLELLLVSRLGIGVPAFEPHVTLGYFANRTASPAAEPLVGPLDRRLRGALGEGLVAFGDPTPCTFESMAAFVPVSAAQPLAPSRVDPA